MTGVSMAGYSNAGVSLGVISTVAVT